MNVFSKMARKALSGCPLMDGREKVSTEVILAENPDGVTIAQFDFANSTKNGEYAVIVLAEYPDRYYPSGSSITTICQQWIEEYQGDVARANEDLAKAGGCRVRLERVRTAKGNPFIRVTVL